jgi:putative mycofactocin binding protein MftB
VSTIDLSRPWVLDAGVALRPEPFGALAYHFGTRRLSFLKSRMLLGVVRALGEHPSGLHACRAAGVPEDELPRYAQALGTLADTHIIVPREDAP